MSACSAAAASRALRPAAQPRTAGMHRRGCSSRSSLPAPDGRRLTSVTGRGHRAAARRPGASQHLERHPVAAAWTPASLNVGPGPGLRASGCHGATAASGCPRQRLEPQRVADIGLPHRRGGGEQRRPVIAGALDQHLGGAPHGCHRRTEPGSLPDRARG